MIDATVRFVGANGQTVTLTNKATDLLRQPGGGGWGMAPVVNSWFEGAGEGARLRGTRRGRRELTIPVAAFGASRGEIDVKLRQLGRTIHDPFRVYVDFDDGRTFWIEAVYEDGAQGSYTMAPEYYAELPIVLSCPDPYWTSDDSQVFTIAPASALAPFLPKLADLSLGSSAALGTAVINNAGDVSSRPSWEVHGPGTDLTVSLGAMGFVLRKTLTASETVYIKYELGGWTVKDQSGVNLYGYLDPAPWFPEFPPGLSNVTASMGSTGTQSYIRATYPERREIVYGG